MYMDLPKAYNSKDVEDNLYEMWEESGYFNPDNLPGERQNSYSIPLPPPNATGILHLGHSLMLVIQDTLTRYHRMKGDKTLWLPGTDHAAIATQNVVEKKLIKEEGKRRWDLGREEFLKKVEEFVSSSQGTIKKQMKKMGSSCDWSRERFTLDEGLSRAVQYAFVKMYEDGLIYRGLRVVNWCPKCASTLSDDEVEYKENKAKLYYIKYGPLTVATTRPETKLGDTGVAVNPNDERYKNYIGKELEINLGKVNIKVKVFADRGVDPEFGSGAIGVTPAHSYQDWLWAQEYDLPLIQVIDERGRMTEKAGPYKGLTVQDAREKFVEDLEKANLLEKVEEIDNNLSVCYRCGRTIEPIPSKQWFIDMNKKVKIKNKEWQKDLGDTASLKELADYVVRSGKIQILPERFKKIYFQWIENLRDWNISRQIWYGHRMPVWYKGEDVYVGLEKPEGEGWMQDEDTLDTWFSSALWTFSTLGWPENVEEKGGEIVKKGDLAVYHPTSVLETGYDILFFWVARMIIMTTYHLGEIPFKTVYLHGMIRDRKGQKMSKSKGNGIDPIEMIEKYGADALRLSLISNIAPGGDIKIYEEKIKGNRNFINKLWNIARFILMKINEKGTKPSINIDREKLTLSDKWILTNLHHLIQKSTQNLEKYNLSYPIEGIYEFTWHQFADWYLEISKFEENKENILLYILYHILKLAHPYLPYITEHIWQILKEKNLIDEDMLIVASWPEADESLIFPEEKERFKQIQDIVIKVRNWRSENQIPWKEEKEISITSIQDLTEEEKKIITKLTNTTLSQNTQNKF